MIFYLGTHHPNWLGLTATPLFVSRRTLYRRKAFPRARGPWVLDSGGYTELSRGSWSIEPWQYAQEVRRYQAEIGGLAWVAPMDYMCEPHVLAKTGLSLDEHLQRTVRNFLELRSLLGWFVAPVLQGWARDDYLRCWQLYEAAGVSLEREPIVAVGSVCRRNQDAQIAEVIRSLAPLRLHGFGVRGRAAKLLRDDLVSVDSMAWSYRARRQPPLPGCTTHINCANCMIYALKWWRERQWEINAA